MNPDAILDFVISRLRSFQFPQLRDLVEDVNRGLPAGRRVSFSAVKKLYYGETDDPRISTVQPLVSFFRSKRRRSH